MLDLHGDGHRDNSCTALDECQCGSRSGTRPQATLEGGVAIKGGVAATLAHQRWRVGGAQSSLVGGKGEGRRVILGEAGLLKGAAAS